MTRLKIMLAALVTLLVTAALMAQEAPAAAAAGAATEVEDVSMVTVLFQGGMIGHLIIVMSVIGGALIIEYFVSLKRDKLVPPDTLAELEHLLEEENYDEAMDLCDSDPSPLSRVFGAGLPHINHGYEVMAGACHKAAENETVRLHQKISWLALLGNVGPMCGLLGTVWGMILAFNKIAQLGAPDPAQLADSISIALVTTVLGLVLAIPTMAFFFYFRNRLVRAMTDVENIVSDLLERFRPAA